MGFVLFWALLLSAHVQLWTASALKVSFGSCNKQDGDQSYWSTILQRKPDVWIWGGDIVYGDQLGLFRAPRRSITGFDNGMDWVEGGTHSCLGGVACFSAGTPEHLAELYDQVRSNAGYQALSRSVSKVLGIWDDHDMGLNDGDRRYRWMNQSKQALLDFLDVPGDSPRRTRRGVWDTFLSPGEPGRRVAIHMLDVRHNKAPYGTEGGDFLGEEQWAWLNQTLHDVRDEAGVNIVVSGLQVLRPWPRVSEVWGRFPGAKERLLRTLVSSGARGVVILSGDAHMAQLNAVRCGDSVIYDLTSSGLTHSLDDLHFPANWLARVVLWVAPQNHLVGSTFFRRNVGELDIDFDDSGTPSVRGRILSLHPGESRGQVVMDRSLLEFPTGAGQSGRSGSLPCAPIAGAEPIVWIGVRLMAVVLSALTLVSLCCLPVYRLRGYAPAPRWLRSSCWPKVHLS